MAKERNPTRKKTCSTRVLLLTLQREARVSRRKQKSRRRRAPGVSPSGGGLGGKGPFRGFAFRLRQAFSPIRRGPPFCTDRKGGKNGLRGCIPPCGRERGLEGPLGLHCVRFASQPANPLDIPAPAHRRRALRFGPRDRRLHWRRTAAPSKGGLHESQPAYPDRSICGGWAVGERTSPPLILRLFRRARRSVAVQWASGGAACGGNAAAPRRDCKCVGGWDFDGVIGWLRRSHPLLEGGGPKGRGILIAEGGSFGACPQKNWPGGSGRRYWPGALPMTYGSCLSRVYRLPPGRTSGKAHCGLLGGCEAKRTQ